jgi:hypothetical protein
MPPPKHMKHTNLTAIHAPLITAMTTAKRPLPNTCNTKLLFVIFNTNILQILWRQNTTIYGTVYIQLE